MMVPRMRILLAGMLTIMVIFVGQLMYLQFAQAQIFRQKSERNVTEERRITPLRGRILARDGTVLADNRIAYDLMYNGGEIEHWVKLKHILKLDAYPPEPNLSDANERDGVVIAWNISDHLIPAIEELAAGQGSLALRKRMERTYPTNLAAHVIGYTTNADPDRFPGYALGDLVGQKGIEASYQETLFGQAGKAIATVDNRGITLTTAIVNQAYPGDDIMLTIDPQIQRMAEEVLHNSITYVNTERQRKGHDTIEIVRGALIALDPRSGDILAMASAPSFDQNIFTHRPSSPENIQRVLGDAVNLPLINRAVEAYPPASTFKLVTSLTLLENGYISPSSRFACSAYFDFRGIRFNNWATYDRGSYTVTDAIGDSCNTFYWRAINSTPNVTAGWGDFIQALMQRAHELGYGQVVGIGLEEEEAGRIPTETWVIDYFGHPWYPGQTMNAAIGQGDILATPIQVAQLASFLALDGVLIKPHLIKQIGSQAYQHEQQSYPSSAIDTVKAGMRSMMTEYGARNLLGPNTFPIATAGKTGTAQNSGIDHAWFMGYGPIENPELVVVVFIENGGSSTAVAIPIARDFMAKFWAVE